MQTLYTRSAPGARVLQRLHTHPDTPLADAPATDPRREFRLYQADWLLRYYNFSVDELLFDSDGQLSTQSRPETSLGPGAPRAFPDRSQPGAIDDLLRIPGIGPLSARAIVQARRQSQALQPGRPTPAGRPCRSGRALCALEWPASAASDGAQPRYLRLPELNTLTAHIAHSPRLW